MLNSVCYVAPLELTDYCTFDSGLQLHCCPGQVTRYNNAPEVVLTSDWCGGDFKQLVFAVIQIGSFG